MAVVELSFKAADSAFMSSCERFLVAAIVACDDSSLIIGGELGGDERGLLICSVSV